MSPETVKSDLMPDDSPPLKTIQGYDGPVLSVCLSSDGERALSGGDDGMLRLWNVNTGQQIRVFKGHEGWVQSVCLSSDGKQALSGSYDGTLRFWDVNTGQQIRVFKGHKGWVRSVFLSSDGEQVLSGGNDGTLRLWDINTSQQTRVFQGHKGWVLSVCLSSDGERALSGGNDGTLRLWDINTGQQIRVFKGHKGPVLSVCLSSDGEQVLSGGNDGTIRLWDVNTGKELQVFQGHEGWVLSVCLSPDGELALSGGDDGTLRLWDVNTGKEQQVFKGHKGSVLSVCLSSDGERALSGSSDRKLCLWDVNTGKPLEDSSTSTAPLSSSIEAILQAHQRAILARETIQDDSIDKFLGHDGSVWSTCLSSDGERALSGGDDGTLRLWNVNTGKELQVFKGHDGPVLSVCLSSDEERALLGGDDGVLRLWDVNTGKELQVFQGHEGWVLSVCLSSDGELALSGGDDGTLRLWNVNTGKELQVFQGHDGPVLSVCLSSDGERALSGGNDGTLRLWDINTGQLMQVFQGHEDWIRSVCLSSDGERALSGSIDHTLRLWDVNTGKELQVFQGHEGWVLSVCLSSDGELALSGGDDGTLRLWDVNTGKELQVFQGHDGSVISVCLSSDGERALSGGNDGTLRLWDFGELSTVVPSHWVAFHGVPGREAEPFQNHAHSLGRGLASGNIGLRSTGTSGVPAYVFQAARDTLIKGRKSPRRFLINIVRDFVRARRFEQRVLTEEERTDGLLTGSTALVVFGNVDKTLAQEAIRRSIPVIPVQQTGTYTRRLLAQSLEACKSPEMAQAVKEAAELLGRGDENEIAEKFPQLLEVLAPTVQEQPDGIRDPTTGFPPQEDPDEPLEAFVQRSAQAAAQQITIVARQQIENIYERAEEVRDSTLDVHLMPDTVDPYFTCLTFRDRDRGAPVFFEGRLELPEAPHERTGTKLFDAVFSNARPRSVEKPRVSYNLRDAFQRVTGRVREAEGECLHLHLRINNNLKLHDIEWESMQDGGNEPLAVAQATPFARALHTSIETPSTLTLTRGEKVRALLVRSSPGTPTDSTFIPVQDLVRLREDLKTFDQPIEFVTLGDNEASSVTLDDIVVCLQRARYENKPFHLLYLMCHGSLSADGSSGLLLGSQRIEDHRISTRLREIEGLRAIVLASCWTALPASGSALKGVARSLVDAGFPAVVAMQKQLSFDGAMTFSRRFFLELLHHGEADVATNAARRELWEKRQTTATRKEGELHPEEWYAPVLFQRYQCEPLWEWAEDATPPWPDLTKLPNLPSYPIDAIPEVLDHVVTPRLQTAFQGLPFSVDRLAELVKTLVHSQATSLDAGEPPQCWTPQGEQQSLTDPEALSALKQELQTRQDSGLDYGELPILERALSALEAGKHIILCGPPGTGKTTLAEAICEYASKRGYCSGHVTVTATADWTTFETIGGLMPGADRRLRFRPGIFPTAFKNGHWVVLDELNRADIDKAFGELFTFLSGQGITLPYFESDLPVRIRPETDRLSGKGWDYTATSRWRMIGTMNVFDKASLFKMSLAFQRRFAFIDVPLPKDGTFRQILNVRAEGLDTTVRDKMYHLFLDQGEGGSPLRRYRGMGPAIAVDLLKYLSVRGGGHLSEAICLYIVPQLEGLEEEAIDAICKHLCNQCCDGPGTSEWKEVYARIRELYPFKNWPDGCP